MPYLFAGAEKKKKLTMRDVFENEHEGLDALEAQGNPLSDV